MRIVVRRCSKCGNDDLRHQWDSMHHAAAVGALRAAWSCPDCAWPEADLVEVESSSEESVAVPASAHAGEARR
jgi:hypothetical protein